MSSTFRANLRANLAAMGAHRPEVYRAMMDTGLAGGTGETRELSVPVGGAPEEGERGAREVMGQLRPACERGEAVTLCGIGNGGLLGLLADDPPKLALGMELPVYVIEPDAAAVLGVLARHDFTGQAGPIQHPRFQWFVGEHWDQALCEMMEREDHLPNVTAAVTQSPRGEAIARGIGIAGRARAQVDEQLKERVEGYYASMSRGDLVAVLGANPARPPRALVLTCRFTTVLQYASRDVAEALKAMGWRARVEIEPTGHHRLTNMVALRRALGRWRPDVVLVLDHLRQEYRDAFPANLPFVCWIQDHLKNLTRKAAGASITRRDFVLSSVVPLYTSLYGYPERQCIAGAKLTRVPRRPARWTSDGDDLTYVSHASKTPERIARQLVDECGQNAAVQRVIETCGDRMIRLYDGGGRLATLQEVGELVDAVSGELGLPVLAGEARYTMVDALFTRLNNALYRQQTLGWVVDIAEDMGLSLAIHGRGWEAHPRFAAYARGPIDYGRPLERVTRASRINLQIVPYFCLHQRLLDGLVAGGFFLVREHPSDTLLPEFGRFLDAHFGPEVQSLADARRAAGEALGKRLDAMLERCKVMSELGTPIDMIQWVRGCQWARLMGEGEEDGGGQALPRLDEVSFDSRASLEARIGRFLADDNLRARIAGDQRAAVESRLSYTAGMRRVMGRVRELLAGEVDERTFDAGVLSSLPLRERQGARSSGESSNPSILTGSSPLL